MKKLDRYSPEQCIIFWEDIKSKTEAGEKVKLFSDSYTPQEIVAYCDRMIELNKNTKRA
jgi:predicted flavoprotein YhiN